MGTKKEKNPDRLPVGKFFAWKSRDISLAGIAIVMGYLSLYCTDTLGMPAALVGTLLMASKIADAFTDLFTGIIVDNTRSRWGKGRPYEFCILGSWLCTALLFFASPEWSMVVKSVWVFIMYTFVFSIFNSMLGSCATPYMIRAFKNRSVIVKVSSYGGIVSTFGAMIVSVSFPMLMAKLATSDAGWRSLILIYAVPLALIGMMRFIFVKEEVIMESDSVDEKVGVKTILKMMKTNKFIWSFAGIFGLFNVTQGMAVLSYYFKYVIGNLELMSVFGVVSILLLPVMFTFPALMKKFSVSNLITMGAGLAAIGYGINFIAGTNLPLLFIGSIFTAMAMFPIAYLQSVIIMSLATYNEWNGLPRMEGSVGIFSGFAGNVGNGIGAGLLGILLGVAGYDGTAAVQPDSAVMMIRFLYSIIPLVMMVFIVIFAMILSKLEKKVPQMEKDNEERKKSLQNV